MSGTTVLVGQDYNGHLKQVAVSEHNPASLLTINGHHELMHKGQKFGVEIAIAALAADATQYVTIILPDREVHIESLQMQMIAATGGVTLEGEIYSDITTATAAGDTVAVNFNLDKIGDSKFVAETLFHSDGATPSDLGTKLPFTVNVATANQTYTEGVERKVEFLSETAKKMCIKLHNSDAQAVKIILHVIFYEVEEHVGE